MYKNDVITVTAVKGKRGYLNRVVDLGEGGPRGLDAIITSHY